MADKQIVFEDQDQQYVEGILIDRDKEEALKFLAQLVERFKGTYYVRLKPVVKAFQKVPIKIKIVSGKVSTMFYLLFLETPQIGFGSLYFIIQINAEMLQNKRISKLFSQYRSYTDSQFKFDFLVP